MFESLTIFLIYVHALCRLYNYIASGGSFALHSGAVDLMRSFRQKTPRNATVGKNSMSIEYKLGEDRLYSIIFPKRHPIPWTRCAAFVRGKWYPVTNEVAFCAGPYKNFYEIPITPSHINDSYEKLGFEIQGMKPVVVKADEYIIAKLREAFRKSK